MDPLYQCSSTFFLHPCYFFVCLGIQVLVDNTNFDVLCSSSFAKSIMGFFTFLAQSSKKSPKKRIKLKPIKLFWPLQIPYLTCCLILSCSFFVFVFFFLELSWDDINLHGDLENQFMSLIWLDVMKKDSIHLICLLVLQLNTMNKN